MKKKNILIATLIFASIMFIPTMTIELNSGNSLFNNFFKGCSLLTDVICEGGPSDPGNTNDPIIFDGEDNPPPS